MALKKAKAQLRILYAVQWVLLSIMMLSVGHQNSMWLMIMPSDLLLVLWNVRYSQHRCSLSSQQTAPSFFSDIHHLLTTLYSAVWHLFLGENF